MNPQSEIRKGLQKHSLRETPLQNVPSGVPSEAIQDEPELADILVTVRAAWPRLGPSQREVLRFFVAGISKQEADGDVKG